MKLHNPEDLASMRDHIRREAPYVGIKPYSHNIIRLVLAHIAHDFGPAEANKAVRDFKLESQGFNQEPEE